MSITDGDFDRVRVRRTVGVGVGVGVQGLMFLEGGSCSDSSTKKGFGG